MRTAIVVFDRLTALDAVGPYEVLSRVGEVVFVAAEPGPTRTDNGMLALHADAALGEVTAPEVVLVPGGPGQSEQMSDGPLHEWLRAVDATTTWTTAVCTGSLILAAAGLLRGRRASTHWLAREQLRRYQVTPSRERVTFDGKYVTAAGVSAGIDMALTFVDHAFGADRARQVQLAIEYDPRPPYDSGSPETAPPEVVEALRARSRFTD